MLQVEHFKLTHRFGFVILAGHSSTALPLRDNLLREVPLGQRPLSRLQIQIITVVPDNEQFTKHAPLNGLLKLSVLANSARLF